MVAAEEALAAARQDAAEALAAQVKAAASTARESGTAVLTLNRNDVDVPSARTG